MVIKPILVTIMENFAYPKTWLTPKLEVDITVRVVKPKHQKEVASWMQWINANLEILHFFSLFIFSVDLILCIQTLLGVYQSPESLELCFFLFSSLNTCGDQDAASYGKIYDVTPSFLFCLAFTSWRFAKNTNKLHPCSSSV